MPELSSRLIERLSARQNPYEIRDARQRGLVLRIQPNGRRLFYFEWQRGRRVALGEFPTVTLALARAECPRVLARVAVGDNPRPLYHRPAPKRPHNPTLNALAAQYQAWFQRDRASQGFDARSLESLNTALRDKDHPPARRAFGELEIDGLTENWIKSWVEEKKDRVRQLTIKRQLSGVRSLLTWAAKEELIGSNPIAHLTPRSLGIDSKKNPDEDAAAVRALTVAEEQRLRAALAERDDYIRPLALVALGTGMRRGELFRLRWGQIEFEHNAITIPKSKSGRRRTVNFSSETGAVLVDWKRRTRRRDRTEALVFPGLDGRSGMVNIKRSWGAVRTVAALPRTRFHDLRHTFASRLLTSGTPIFVVARLLGHSVERTTELYGHLDPEQARKYVEAMSGGASTSKRVMLRQRS